MASTVRMLAAGLSLAGNTFALVIFALGGGAVFTQIQIWYSSWHYEKPPVIDPSLVQWIFPTFYAMLLVLEVVLIYAVYQTIFSREKRTTRIRGTQMRYTAFLIALLMIAGVCSALPTTGAASLISSNNVTVTMTGAATTCWFQWGIQSGSNMTWRTPNATPAAGVCTQTIKGSPLSGNQLFYYRACDVTGCGASASFTTLSVTAIPTPTYGDTFTNLTENNFDITLIGAATMASYMWLLPTFPALIWSLIFMFIFIGLWLRGRDMGIIVGIAFIIAGMLLFPAYGLGIPIDPVFAAAGQGILYACFAGVVLVIIKK